jgi:hemerythrin-like domain-containing protein
MEIQARGQKRMVVDPMVLLKREHEVILDRLHMIEATLDTNGDKSPAPVEPDRRTLRELFRFFTSRVEIHFKREAVLIAALSSNQGGKRDQGERFHTLMDEHRAMKADAARIAKQLSGKAAGAWSAGADPFGIRSFVRQYRGHISCEERILFVLADMRLTAAQKLQVSRRMLQV